MLNIKEHILKNAGRLIKQLMAPIDFHSISFPTMEVDGGHQPPSLAYQQSSKYVLLC